VTAAVWPAVIYGKRQFAWTWTPIENGKEVRWKWVVKLTPLGGILPTYNGQILTHTRSVPFCHASPIKQFKHDLKGRIMNITRTHRVAITLLVWLIAVESITILVSFVFGYPPEFGGFRVGLPMPLYIPGAFVMWGAQIAPGYQWIIAVAEMASIVVGVGLLLRLAFDMNRARGVQDARVHQGIYGGREQARKDHLL
jgi:hypothetical protein